MNPFAFLSLPQVSAATDPATFTPLEAAIPTDPASLFVYVLVGLSIYFIWKGSRKKPGSGQGA